MAVSEPDGPVDWIPGGSRLGWSAGFLIVFCAAFMTTYFLLGWELGWNALTGSAGDPPVALLVASVAVAVGPAAFWTRTVPMPAPRLGITPGGLVMEEGAVREVLPWDQVAVEGTLMRLTPVQYRMITTYRLTDGQATRLAIVRPRS